MLTHERMRAWLQSRAILIALWMLAIVAFFALTGCAGISEIVAKREALYKAAPVNPPSVHPGPDAYRKALSVASAEYGSRLGMGQTATVPALVDAGIAAANHQCRAWLGAVSAAEQRWRHGEQNISVIQALITGILAASGVHSDVILAYGLGVAAWQGYSQGFMQNVLVMADWDLQTKVREAMVARATELRSQAATMTYAQALDAIGEFETICTPQAARALSRSALAAVKTTIAPSGSIHTEPVAVTSQYQPKDDSAERIGKYWAPGDQVDPQHEAQIRQWLDSKGVRTSITFFLHAPIYESARKQMVDELRIPADPPKPAAVKPTTGEAIRFSGREYVVRVLGLE